MTKWGQANDATKTKIRRIESRSNISSISQEAVFSAQMLFCWWIKWTSCCSLFSIPKTAVRTTRGITSQVTSIKAGLFVVFIALLPNQIVASRKKGIQVKWGFIDNFLLLNMSWIKRLSLFGGNWKSPIFEISIGNHNHIHKDHKNQVDLFFQLFVYILQQF